MYSSPSSTKEYALTYRDLCHTLILFLLSLTYGPLKADNDYTHLPKSENSDKVKYIHYHKAFKEVKGIDDNFITNRYHLPFPEITPLSNNIMLNNGQQLTLPIVHKYYETHNNVYLENTLKENSNSIYIKNTNNRLTNSSEVVSGRNNVNQGIQLLNTNAATPTITLGTIPAVCGRATSFQIPYTSTTNSPNEYMVTGIGVYPNQRGSLSGASGVIKVSIDPNNFTGHFTLVVLNTINGALSSPIDGFVAITKIPAPTLQSTSTSICSGDSITITASNCTGIVQWNTGETGSRIQVAPTSTITYSASCANNGCTSTSNSISINVKKSLQCKSLASGSWNSPTTWSCGRVPQSCDDVIVQSDHIVTLDREGLAKTIQIENPAQLQFTNTGSLFNSSTRAHSGTFIYTLKERATTSAGVYRFDGADDILIRTLWSNVHKEAGAHTGFWDGKDDEGNLVENGQYKVKVLSNQVQYQWEGTIGNNSTMVAGFDRHNWNDRMYDAVRVGNRVFYVLGYQEGTAAQRFFDLNTPRISYDLYPRNQNGTGLLSHAVCSDGINVYWGGYASSAGYSGIFATQVADPQKEVIFSTGAVYDAPAGRDYASIIDRVSAPYASGRIHGLAVYKDFLFVARPFLNTLRVVDKRTGALVRELTIPKVAQLAIDQNGNLWMVSGEGKVSKHTINPDGTLSGALLTLPGISYALSLTISPDNSVILVGDGGKSDNYKAFSVSTGQQLWTLGQEGGYAKSPDVTYDKFMFHSTKEWKTDRDYWKVSTAIFESDGSLWAADWGNQRIIHYSADRKKVLNEILNVGYNYSAWVSRKEPNRVFCNYMEFEIDYSKPLAANNGSWKLKRNWAYHVIGDRDDQMARSRIVKLSNGRDYALIRYNGPTYEFVEFDPAHGIRYTGVILTPTYDRNYMLNEDGTITCINFKPVGQVTKYYKRSITGFTSDNNPILSPESPLVSTPAIKNTDPIGHAGGGFGMNQYLSNKQLYITFTADADVVIGGVRRGYGFHLGGLKEGKWLWKTSPATNKGYKGPWPLDGAFDTGNGTNYGGNMSTTIGDNIFWGFNGEFWKGSQTNKYAHYSSNGLLINQFGITGPETMYFGYPGFAGNARSWSLAELNGNIYMYHPDESQHAAIHRWKISGLNTVREQTINFTKSENPAPLPVDYIDLMEGLPYYSTVQNGTSGWTRSPVDNVEVNKSNWWSVKTNVQTYRRDHRDVDVILYTTNGVPTTGLVTRSLPLTENSSTWRIEGEVTYIEPSESDGTNGWNYFEILDENGKVLARFKRGNELIFNNKIVLPSTGVSTSPDPIIIRVPRPLTIGYNGKSMYCQYNGGAIITAPTFDGTANPQRPRQLRIHLYSSNGRGHLINVSNLKLYN